VLASLLLAVTLAAEPGPAFAFSDADGKRLLSLGPVGVPARLTRASCDGRVVDVAFLSQQPKGAKDTGRQTAANFDQVSGALYEVKGDAVPPDAPCLLADGAFFRVSLPVAVTASQKPCDAKASAAVTRLNKRKVERCLEVGAFPGGRLVLVTFARSGKALLVGLVLLAEKVTAMRSFPATFEPGAPSCWRVDDGCVFEPGAYHVPFVLAGPSGPTPFGLWDGAEGQNLELLEVRGAALEGGLTASRYWSPL